MRVIVHKSITRVDLVEAVRKKAGLSRAEAQDMVEQVLAEITACLTRGQTVKLSAFGSFSVRSKGERIGRNPKTRQEIPIAPASRVGVQAEQHYEAENQRGARADNAEGVPISCPYRRQSAGDIG